MMTDQAKRESMKTTILIWAVGLIATIMVAAIPWAFYISTNVARIDQKLSDLKIPSMYIEEKVDDLEDQIKQLRKELLALKK